MNLQFENGSVAGTGLFRDLATYAYVDDWLGAIVRGESAFDPADVSVWVGGSVLTVVENGVVSPGAADAMIRVRALSWQKRQLARDAVLIRADGHTRRLYVAVP